ncbi:MAG: insulinase family protein [Clostridia bacterium]|nr:insulinase family protein [Clostridia bacterium]
MFKTKTAAPGVRVVSVKTDKYKTNIIDISMAVPLDENAAANALLIGLLSRSCKDYPDFTSLNAKLDELYGASLGCSVRKIGDAQVLSLSVTCLDDRFALEDESITDECAKLLCDLIFNPNVKGSSFGKDALKSEKRLLINNILAELDNKRYYALKKCTELMCANEPFGRSEYGTVEEVENVKMADIFAAWKNLLKTAVIQITTVGCADITKINRLFSKQFKTVDRDPCEINTIFFKKGQHFRRGVEQFPMKQGKLVFGFRTGSEDRYDNYFPLRVMCDIFGGGTYSKLFANVREKMSLAYYCSASLVSSKGIIFVQSGIDTDKEKQVSTAIINQLDDVRKGKFDDETLAASKRSLREGLTLSTPEAVCGWYKSFILEDNIMTPEETADGYDKVTKEEVCEAAKLLSIDKIYMLEAVESEDAEDEV